MKDKLTVPKDFIICQDSWHDSPCSRCPEIPCCRNLPLAQLWLERQCDFINLITASCYDGFFPVLKKSGEWLLYLSRNCSYLEKPSGKCSIHDSMSQSLVCKSYDAHKCWYVDAFRKDKYSTIIPFNTEMLIWFEKKYRLIEKGFDTALDWPGLCKDAYEYRSAIPDLNINENYSAPASWTSRTLSFRKSREDQFLFFPPYKRPEHMSHFELISFRLGFPGVYLAVSDNVWAFMIKTSPGNTMLNMIRKEYYPAIGHKDVKFSFDSLMKECRPFSESGEQWVILRRSNLELLKAVTVFDSSGKVKRLPSTSEILDILKYCNPDAA